MGLFDFLKKKKAQSVVGHTNVSSLPTAEHLVTMPEDEQEKYKTLALDMLFYKVLDPVDIDIEYVTKTRGLGICVSKAVETEKYIFYTYSCTNTRLVLVLRQSKENRNDVCYFGLRDSYSHVLFNGYIFYKQSSERDNTNIGCVDPETGKRIRLEVLSKKTYVITCFPKCQDKVREIKVINNQLEVKVERTRSDCFDDDPFDLNTTYFIYISCEDGRFSVGRVFFDINLDKVKIFKRGRHHRWCIVEGDGKYFFLSNDQKIAKSSKGYVLQTVYLPLAEKILDELDSFGEESCPAVSFLGLHKVMCETFSTLTRNAAQKFIEDAFLNKEDWLFSIPETDHMWKKVIGTQETRKLEISNWLSKTLHMQINSSYCLCQRYNSLNLAFVVAMITESVPEESYADYFEQISLYLSEKSQINIDPKDLQVFAFYYRLPSNDTSHIFKDLGVGEDIDFKQILTGNASKEPEVITEKETNHSTSDNTKEVLQPITINDIDELPNHYGKFVKLEINGLDNSGTFKLRHPRLSSVISEEMKSNILAKPLSELWYHGMRGDTCVKIEPISLVQAKSYEDSHYIYGILHRRPRERYVLTNAFITSSSSHLQIIAQALNTQGMFEYTVLDDGTLSIFDFISEQVEHLEIPEKIDGKVVTAISSHAFSDNQTIKTLKIPDSVKTIEYSFSNCNNLESAYLGDGVETVYAFDCCEKLKKVYLGKSVSDLEHSFHNCHELSAFEIAPDNDYFCVIDGVLFSKDKTKLVLCPCGKKGIYTIPYGTKAIGEDAFENSDLEEIIIPNTVEILEYGAFEYTWGMKKLTIPSSVVEIGYEAISAGIKEIVIEQGSYAQQYFEELDDDRYHLTVVSKLPADEVAAPIPANNSDKLFCRRCGTQLPIDSDFCFKCGTKVENSIV